MIKALLSAITAFQIVSGASVSKPAHGLPGFVQTNGTRFSLDGSRFTVVGANAYWIGLAGLSDGDMDKAFADIATMGATTVRVWAFNEMEETMMWIPRGVYYNIWSGNQSAINYSETGLGYFDRVIASARRNNLRLIVLLTANWNSDWVYGGAEAYIRQIVGSGEWHEIFFSSEKIKNAFKTYVTAVVERYKNESTILSWELGESLRCSLAWSPSNPICSPEIITSWIKEMSSHIKAIDSNHLVAVGDEGFYNRQGEQHFVYNGRDGLDFDLNIAIDTIDYGTFAYLPGSYPMPTHTDEPLIWIEEHGKSQTRAGKPVVLSRIGREIRPHWLVRIVESGIAGALYWQAGMDSLDLNMPFWFVGDYIGSRSDTFALLKRHAEALKTRP